MKAHLLYPDRDFDLRARLPWGAAALIRDLELDRLFEAMAGKDAFLQEVAQLVVLTGMQEDLAIVRHRQDVLRDCLDHPSVLRALYAVAVEATESEKRHYLGSLGLSPDWVLRWSVEMLADLLGAARKLRGIADLHAAQFRAPAWSAFFATLRRELDDTFFSHAMDHLQNLRFRQGVVFSASLGAGLKGADFILHRGPAARRGWFGRIFEPRPESHGFSLHPRDEAGHGILTELRNRGTAIAAAALGQSADHVRDFFILLRRELAFYVGCVNLHEHLGRIGVPTCMPSAEPNATRRLSGRGLYDLCLALKTGEPPVGNDIGADGKDIVVITGANQGGKSTFLRALGVARIMAQCGMFVGAEELRISLCDGLFTHFRREEDTGMRSGKLDEELSRMSGIVDHARPGSAVLFNESFAATNEREGSEIAGQIVSALLERGILVAFVTHLFEFPRALFERPGNRALFLRAGRARSFRLEEGEPLRTSFGEDLYDSVFGQQGRGAATGAAASPGRPASPHDALEPLDRVARP